MVKVATEPLDDTLDGAVFQLYVTSVFGTLVTVTDWEALLQSNTKAVDVILGVGEPAFGKTSTVDVAIQPFNGSVAVNVYIPAPFTVVV